MIIGIREKFNNSLILLLIVSLVLSISLSFVSVPSFGAVTELALVYTGIGLLALALGYSVSDLTDLQALGQAVYIGWQNSPLNSQFFIDLSEWILESLSVGYFDFSGSFDRDYLDLLFSYVGLTAFQGVTDFIKPTAVKTNGSDTDLTFSYTDSGYSGYSVYVDSSDTFVTHTSTNVPLGSNRTYSFSVDYSSSFWNVQSSLDSVSGAYVTQAVIEASDSASKVANIVSSDFSSLDSSKSVLNLNFNLDFSSFEDSIQGFYNDKSLFDKHISLALASLSAFDSIMDNFNSDLSNFYYHLEQASIILNRVNSELAAFNAHWSMFNSPGAILVDSSVADFSNVAVYVPVGLVHKDSSGIIGLNNVGSLDYTSISVPGSDIDNDYSGILGGILTWLQSIYNAITGGFNSILSFLQGVFVNFESSFVNAISVFVDTITGYSLLTGIFEHFLPHSFAVFLWAVFELVLLFWIIRFFLKV